MSIGQELAAARVAAGLSVEQVSAATRIRQTLVKAIENDDFSLSGGDFYARAHIRSVAQAVHTDPAPLLSQYDAASGAAGAPTTTAVFETESLAHAERRGPNWSAAMAAALALVVIYGAAQFLTGSDGARPAGTVAGPVAVPAEETPAASPNSPHAPNASAPDAPAPDAIAQAPRDRVTVDLVVSDGKSWVAVTNAAGETLFQGLLDEGQEKSWTDRKAVKMTIGNAGAVSLVVNGKDVGAPGSPGEVARVQFTPQDPDNA